MSMQNNFKKLWLPRGGGGRWRRRDHWCV